MDDPADAVAAGADFPGNLTYFSPWSLALGPTQPLGVPWLRRRPFISRLLTCRLSLRRLSKSRANKNRCGPYCQGDRTGGVRGPSQANKEKASERQNLTLDPFQAVQPV